MRGEPVRPQPRPVPAVLERAAKRSATQAKDKAENAKARKRADGLCEVLVREAEPVNARVHIDLYCNRRDTQTHHLISGIGRRNRGDSLLAVWKLRVCAACHALITAHQLVPVDPKANAEQIVYRRAR